MGEEEMKFILAGNPKEFFKWCAINNENPHLGNRVRFIHDKDVMLGRINPEVIKYGTWNTRKDADEILKIIECSIKE